ncbi:alpha-L-rhamnosidase-related protein [Paenibacillus puerhi]|uniref:alpha-L-rhamnosidase-related protein n=1 Tax=Paenibacillus puerhi TaxID=2692622 RepID=UPI00135B6B22|nr:sugar hydrolase [Paenibacillus puerhi]
MSMNVSGGEVRINQQMVDYAEQLIPALYQEKVYPKHQIEVIQDERAFQGWKTNVLEGFDSLQEKTFGKGDSFILDFGDHQVGYVSISIKSVGSPPDAPLGIKFIFGEMPCEVAEPFEAYNGWLSSSWLQEETRYVDVLPAELHLPRRYSFRYMKVIILDTSRKYTVAFSDIHCTAVTSADVNRLTPLPEGLPEDLQRMDRISVRTLQNCMQTVFEDGPKRDRRLWIGDLRLQALANYYTFHHHDLVKRGLYLFGGMTLNEGQVGACLFEKPSPHVDDTLLYDYSLFFTATLSDYYEATQDMETLRALWPVAWEQLMIALRRLDERHIVRDDPSWWCFIDWQEGLNKQASAQAILLYSLKKGIRLAQALQLSMETELLESQVQSVAEAARKHLWDSSKGYFVSGEDAQVSWASQIWMILAGVWDQTENVKLLERLFADRTAVSLSTPYMYHHLIEALMENGMKDKAIEQMRYFWGGMMEDGADCFWELYNPEDKSFSPYGSNLINSYCHAWSCTPTYFIRKYMV